MTYYQMFPTQLRIDIVRYMEGLLPDGVLRDIVAARADLYHGPVANDRAPFPELVARVRDRLEFVAPVYVDYGTHEIQMQAPAGPGQWVRLDPPDLAPFVCGRVLARYLY